MVEQLPLPINIQDIGVKVGRLVPPVLPPRAEKDTDGLGIGNTLQLATTPDQPSGHITINGETPVPTSSVLVYKFPVGRSREFEVVVAERIVPPGVQMFLEGPALPGESPRECALRVMREQAGLVPNSESDLLQEFPGPVYPLTSYGLLAFSLFSCDFANTNGVLELQENQRDQIFLIHPIPSDVLYYNAIAGQINMVNLAGSWQQRLREAIKKRNRRKKK